MCTVLSCAHEQTYLSGAISTTSSPRDGSITTACLKRPEQWARRGVPLGTVTGRPRGVTLHKPSIRRTILADIIMYGKTFVTIWSCERLSRIWVKRPNKCQWRALYVTSFSNRSLQNADWPHKIRARKLRIFEYSKWFLICKDYDDSGLHFCDTV
jgi:predicted secreted protein